MKKGESEVLTIGLRSLEELRAEKYLKYVKAGMKWVYWMRMVHKIGRELNELKWTMDL